MVLEDAVDGSCFYSFWIQMFFMMPNLKLVLVLLKCFNILFWIAENSDLRSRVQLAHLNVVNVRSLSLSVDVWGSSQVLWCGQVQFKLCDPALVPVTHTQLAVGPSSPSVKHVKVCRAAVCLIPRLLHSFLFGFILNKESLKCSEFVLIQRVSAGDERFLNPASSKS